MPRVARHLVQVASRCQPHVWHWVPLQLILKGEVCPSVDGKQLSLMELLAELVDKTGEELAPLVQSYVVSILGKVRNMLFIALFLLSGEVFKACPAHLAKPAVIHSISAGLFWPATCVRTSGSNRAQLLKVSSSDASRKIVQSAASSSLSICSASFTENFSCTRHRCVCERREPQPCCGHNVANVPFRSSSRLSSIVQPLQCDA